MRNLLKSAAITATLSLTLWGGQTLAAPITTLYNTGVNDDGTVRTDDQLELHYIRHNVQTFISSLLVATSAGGYPIGPWIGDNGASAWISREANTEGDTGVHAYRTTFDLTGLDPLTAQINGFWAADDGGIDIVINGASTGQTSGGFLNFTPFSISSAFVAGINTLDFYFVNSGGPTGLRVEIVNRTANELTAQPPATDVPEPLTLGLLGAGLAGIGAIRRRK